MSSISDPEFSSIEILPEDYKKNDLSFKIIVIGDAGVGKSCLTSKASKGTFDEFYSATVGFEFLTFNVKINDKIIKLQIWDTCGQEIYRSLISSFYRNASLAMIVYSIDNKESFIHINTWLKELKMQSNPDIKIFLIGNKVDLENRVVSYDEAKKLQSENEIGYLCETSAKTGLNAKEVFIHAAKLLYKEHLKYKEKQNNANESEKKVATKLNKGKMENRNKGCCK